MNDISNTHARARKQAHSRSNFNILARVEKIEVNPDVIVHKFYCKTLNWDLCAETQLFCFFIAE